MSFVKNRLVGLDSSRRMHDQFRSALPDDFIDNVISLCGSEGEAWLDALPGIIKQLEKKWAIKAGKNAPDRKSHARLLDEHHETILKWIEEGLTGLRIHEELEVKVQPPKASQYNAQRNRTRLAVVSWVMADHFLLRKQSIQLRMKK